MRSTIILLIIFTISFRIYGQSAYYDRNNIVSAGANLEDNGSLLNARFCTVKIGDSLIRYTPYDVKSYGLKNGKVYFSKNIKIEDTVQRVFLEQLVKGKTSLYYYRGKRISTFFLEKDSTLLFELPNSKKNKVNIFRDTLMTLTSDCPYVTKEAKHVRNTKISLTRLISGYNECTLKPPPFLKYGLVMGYGTSKLIPVSGIETEYLKKFDFKYEGGFLLGSFIEKQISHSNFSLYSGLYFSRYRFSVHQSINIIDFDFVTNISSLKLPIMIKYTYHPSLKIRPFINAGGIVAYNFKINSSFYEATNSLGEITIDDNREKGASFFYRNQIGFATGIGTEYKLNHKNSLFFELRYSNLYGLSDSGSLNNSEFNFITSLSL